MTVGLALSIALVDFLIVFALGAGIATAVTAPDRRRYRKACAAEAARRALRYRVTRTGLDNYLRSSR